MRGFLERSKKFGIKIEPAEEDLAELIDLAQDVSFDHECLENSFIRTDLHDRLLRRIRHLIEAKMMALK